MLTAIQAKEVSEKFKIKRKEEILSEITRNIEKECSKGSLTMSWYGQFTPECETYLRELGYKIGHRSQNNDSWRVISWE